ncbi:hypothetical protein GVO57_11100 [Sphingomonas changnyeongensis]|uniref:Core-binding (CB) domain-containing protein n=1 Tax=Sphingomonas changnyeongensis TaxID=2698679 RepID=A0A7Z2S694_9SPHN|nr:hypothetical protein [Sphingomonas changnyeongensis]QHL91258.1 hypothetical protein GVO57_11100 [Sphingomonas changnyeongensis]
MSVYRDPRSPYWVYEFQFRGRRYKGSTGCKAKRDAERFEREERRRVALGDDIKRSLTLDEAFGLWWEARGRHHASQATENYQLKNLLAGLGKTTALADLGMVELNHYVARRRASVADSSVNREVELLRRVVRYLAALKAYETPEIEWGQLLLKEPKERVRELSADEEAALFAQLPDDLAAVAEFALLSGQRRTSVITLLWSKVDLAGRRAEVRVKGGGWHSFPLTPGWWR